jgi:hypothetical protein
MGFDDDQIRIQDALAAPRTWDATCAHCAEPIFKRREDDPWRTVYVLSANTAKCSTLIDRAGYIGGDQDHEPSA